MNLDLTASKLKSSALLGCFKLCMAVGKSVQTIEDVAVTRAAGGQVHTTDNRLELSDERNRILLL